jgi:8-amino-7-oxononanoate synthase
MMLNFKNDLNNIKAAGLYRKLLTIGSQSAPKVVVEGREMLMMSSNDYLGLCSHPRMKKLAGDALQQWGTGSGASRLISGNVSLFSDLEEKLARFKETEDALVFSSGYMANAGLLTALTGKEDIIYSDKLNHASIIDGCRLSRARVETYPHRDTDALESLLQKGVAYRRRIIVTDGVFSMDGDIAPVPAQVELAEKYDAVLIVDDAHGTGVLGQKGKGTLEHFGLCGNKNVIIMGTMGKALGCFGAFVAGSTELKELLINRARSFIFTTALPPSVVASAQVALQIIEEEPERRQQLRENFSFFKKALNEMGFNTLESQTQIIPIMIGDPQTTVDMAGSLLDEGIFIQAIRPPTVPEGSSRLRITVMATHTMDDLKQALAILEKTGRKFRII